MLQRGRHCETLRQGGGFAVGSSCLLRGHNTDANVTVLVKVALCTAQ